MYNQLTELLNDETDYDEEHEGDFYHQEYKPHKMSKKEFVREMMRLQEERSLYTE
ncbi:MAG: hypothetical protein Q4G58_06865 [bacterium]|nr:hypothetical protein [bacterium]